MPAGVNDPVLAILEEQPYVWFDYTTQDGNIFGILGGCLRACRKHGWSPKACDLLAIEVRCAQSYDEALSTLMRYIDFDAGEPRD